MIHPSYSPLFTLGLLADHSPSPDSGDTAKRGSHELRSFLYLDLADNKPYLPSHKRKCSTLSKSTSWTCTADIKSIYDFARSEKSTTTLPSVPAVSTRRRKSKESLRSIPSPKPAPSVTLPDLPITSAPKRPASTVVTSLPSPARVPRPASLRSESIASHERRKSRMDALACLEGRSSAPNRVPRPSTLRKNFMSFSDDEDDKLMSPKSTTHKAATASVAQSEDLSGFADVEDEVDAVIPSILCKREREESLHGKPARKRRGTIESWFPLKSFIDFKDDDLSSWNWRSFIEIGGVS
ncbi:hypothetical protein JVU11DRAFT_10485 [Chiua virens]|nr:hypothetical protein JVU11DRAFT_10485 [Chiua virens]